ncbi:MAG TPA: ParB/RepB/Spo0J family partition protein [Sphingomonadaceae bacterium]|nr:ParB/RepB/Spo0J family partition protein [Sphingomonadaceae bacterium]
MRLSGAPRQDARRKLGRGLGALLGEARREEPLAAKGSENQSAVPIRALQPVNAGEGLANIPVAEIRPHPDQPRRHFDEDSLKELAASIASRGVIQPVIVRPLAEGYQLVAGERRWRAAQRAQLHEIPALIRDLSDRDVMALSLIENIQREDLNPVEEARAYHRLAEQEGLAQAEIARLVEKSRSHVANLQRLLGLPEAVLELLEQGKLTMGHARALIGHEQAVSIALEAVAKGLSVRAVERLVRASRSSEKTSGASTTRRREDSDDADIAAVQNHLEELLGLQVRINTDADPRSGAVTIRYRTLDQLDLICQRLTGGGI